MNESDDKEPWHLDRKVPITLLAAIILQTVGFIWWASMIDHQVKANAAFNIVQDGRLSKLEESRQTTGERLSRIEQLSSDIAGGLRRIDRKLDALGHK